MEIAGISIGIWATFLTFVGFMLALDLGVFHKQAHEVKMTEALTWSAVWVALALVFNACIYFFWDKIGAASNYSNAEAAQAFFAGYLIEKALSIDNIFVFLMVFAFFQVPRALQHRVLFFGILGALFFRAIFIAAGSALLQTYHWVVFIFGGFLVLTGIKMLLMKDKKLDPEKNPVVRGFRALMPVTNDFVGQKFFTKIDGRTWATPLFITLLFIELTDIIFAVDSIPAIFAITKDPFIVFTSNVFAILGLRALFFALEGLMHMFHYLSYGLASILIFVGGKMIYSWWDKFPIGLSLAIIVAILAASVVASLIWKPAPKIASPDPISTS